MCKKMTTGAALHFTGQPTIGAQYPSHRPRSLNTGVAEISRLDIYWPLVDRSERWT
jgi:hypothetical protein